VAYSEELAERIRQLIGGRTGVTERKMFGGVVWMVNGNMACGTRGDMLMVRLDPEDADRALEEPHVRPMEMAGRTMRAFIAVDGAAIASDEQLAGWVDAAGSHAASRPPK
jgi:TfoX/Sxy family transcriptional regulator of competence genes